MVEEGGITLVGFAITLLTKAKAKANAKSKASTNSFSFPFPSLLCGDCLITCNLTMSLLFGDLKYSSS
jgi:hypothetical protein